MAVLLSSNLGKMVRYPLHKMRAKPIWVLHVPFVLISSAALRDLYSEEGSSLIPITQVP